MRVGMLVVIMTALLFPMRMRVFLSFVRVPLFVTAFTTLMWMRVFLAFRMRMFLVLWAIAMVLVFFATHGFHLLPCLDALPIRLL